MSERKNKSAAAKSACGEIESILEARALAVDWIRERLRAGVSDWHEIDGLLRALDRAREMSRARLELDEREARAKAAALDAAGDAADASVQIEFEGWAEEAAR